MTSANFPAPTDDDHEDVHWALSTAGSLHAQGDSEEALRWLRKAAAAALAHNLRERATELDRVAAQIAELHGRHPRASSRPSALPFDEETVQSVFKRPPTRPPDRCFDEMDDGLDDPTHVDTNRTRPKFGISSRFQTAASARSTPGDSDPTLAPHTKSSPGARGGMERRTTVPTTRPGPTAAAHGSERSSLVASSMNADTTTLRAFQLNADDEATVAMRRVYVDDDDELSQSTDSPILSAKAAIPRFRVAMLASADGQDPRVMFLHSAASAPLGAGVAMLLPVSSKDAETIAALLSVPTKKGKRD